MADSRPSYGIAVEYGCQGHPVLASFCLPLLHEVEVHDIE